MDSGRGRQADELQARLQPPFRPRAQRGAAAFRAARPPMPLSAAEIFKRSAIFVAVALVPVLVWLLFDVILISIGAILIATLLTLGAEPLIRWLKLGRGMALVISTLVIISIVAAAGYLFGTRAFAQLHEVMQRTNQAIDSIRASLQGSDFGKLILSHVQASNLSLTNVVTGVFSVSLNFLAGLVFVVFGGIYLAAQVGLYRDGLIQLLPRRLRVNGAETLGDIANALRLWLLGQLISMVLVGLLSALATWLIGLPSPLALGLIAGL